MPTMSSYFTHLLTAFLVLSRWMAHAAPDIQLPTGIARGFDQQATATGKPYFAYFGIPYAEPPVAELRFMPPRPFRGNGSDTIITSDTFRAMCFQAGGSEPAKSEDCLYLNIYTPTDAGAQPLKKVMFWIHGGGFSSGRASDYKPASLVTDRDMIVVVIGYRLAAFGFLSSGDAALPGNMGAKDMLLALHWVKENIEVFGGDPNDVTIFGESAGAVGVAVLSLTPGAKGLFTKGIMQSGTILSPSGVIPNPREKLHMIAEKCGCLPSMYDPWNRVYYHETVVKCLQSKTADEIVAATPDLSIPSRTLSKGTWEQKHLSLVVDGDFLPQRPDILMGDKDYLQRNGVLDRAYMIGLNDNEGLVAYYMQGRDGFTVPAATMASLTESLVRQYYPYPMYTDGGNAVDFIYSYPRDAEGNIPLQGAFDILSDDLFTVPTVKFARAMNEASPSTPVYVYLFNAEPKLRHPLLRGTIHGMELSHEFDDSPPRMERFLWFYAEKDPVKFPIISNAFKGYLTDFAKTGNPSPPNQPDAWPRFDLEKEQYLEISSQPKVHQHMYAQRVSLWTDFLPKVKKMFFSDRTRSLRFRLKV